MDNVFSCLTKLTCNSRVEKMEIFITYVSTVFRDIYACRLYTFKLVADITATFIKHMPLL